MLETLKFVRGAVSNKDLVPVLTHFRINGGRLQGQNGRVTLDAPCPHLDWLDVVVPADKFLRAVDACEGEPKIKVGEDRLTLSRGKFRATLGVLPPEDYPAVLPDLDAVPGCWRSGKGLVDLLSRALPFISTDASRPWSCSLLMTADTAFATNNVVLACFDFDWGCDDLVLPAFCVDEILRIGLDPVRISWDSQRFLATYPDGSWLSSMLIGGEWPNSLRQLHDVCKEEEEWLPLTRDLGVALTKLKPFFPDAKMPVVVVSEEGVATLDGASSALVGLEGLPRSSFRYESLSLVASVAQSWNPARYPNPVTWRGVGVVGMLSGVRT